MSADQLLNLDGVTCLPSKKGETLWHFRCDGATYPARLVNLPCPVEVHKTYDHANYHKSADVGQMLIVYEDQYAMEEAENEKGYRVDGFPSYYHSGLTPPMRKVVQRRYLSRFEERDTKPAPPPKSEVSAVEKELQDLMAKLSTGKGKQKRTGGASAMTGGKVKEIKEVEEEIVDYEPWMGEGGMFTVDEAKMHPECWLSKAEIKEIDATKKVYEEERRAKEAEAAEEARKVREEEKKKQEERAEKKRKKKQKKKKKMQQEEESVTSSKSSNNVPGKKKGIPSLKNREEISAVPNVGVGLEVGASVVGDLSLDDLTQVARAIHEGVQDEDFLLDDDMFDFENDDDITNLVS